MAAADVPSAFGALPLANDPTSDPTTGDQTIAAQKVVLTGDAADLGWSTQILTAAQKQLALRYLSGLNPAMKMFWNYYGIAVSNASGGVLGNAATGSTNSGNNYDATLNPGGLVFPASLTLAYADYMVEGDSFFFMVGANAKFQVYINDAPLTVAPTTGANYLTITQGAANGNDDYCYVSNAGGNQYIKIKWAAAAKRAVRIVSINNVTFSSVWCSKKGSIQPRYTNRPKWLMLTDSYGAGAPGGMPVQAGMGAMLANFFGPEIDCILDGAGATGFGAATEPTIATRLQTSLACLAAAGASPVGCSLIIGQNDTPAQITANAPAALQTLRTLFPPMQIFLQVNYAPGSYATTAAKEQAAVAAITASGVSGVVFISSFGVSGNSPQSGMSILTGTGKKGAAANNGNADNAVSTDGTHPAPYDGTTINGAHLWAEHHTRNVINAYQSRQAA